jgi:regulator of sirC expression with transglutaminase-like and TPR domain
MRERGAMFRLIGSVCFVLLLSQSENVLSSEFHNQKLESAIEALFSGVDDPLTIKVKVDDLVSGQPDGPQVRQAVDALEAKLDELIPANANDLDKLGALKHLLYVSGPWNDERPFSYDKSDPLGKKPENKFLNRYIITRQGNCVTMPILFMILGKHVGLNMTLAEAPFHLLVKYTDNAGAAWNLEATSGGGFSRDVKYRQDLPMTDKAVENGVYLRGLSNEETTAIIASHLVEHLVHSGEFENAIVAADVLLKHYPRSANLMVWKGSAYSQILRRDIVAKYHRESDMTPEIRAYADRLYQENLSAFADAETLGWTEKDGLR